MLSELDQRIARAIYSRQPWDESKVVRDDVGQFADKEGHFERNATRRKFIAELEESGHPESMQREYLSHINHVLNAMPNDAVRALRDNLKLSIFYDSTEALTNEFIGRGVMAGMEAGGAWEGPDRQGKGNLHLDGATKDTSIDTNGIYAHEFGHACDWQPGSIDILPGGVLSSRKSGPISKTSEWLEAFYDELSDQQLSDYAATSEVEGFAEFARLCWGMGKTTDEIKAAYPQCFGVFRKHRLI